MSILGKKWILRGGDINELIRRDASADDETVMFHDPFLMTDMRKAVERLEQAIKSGERVMVFGDYDVDGISGTAILTQVLRALGANMSYRLPNREEGYGLNGIWIERFVELGVNVLITVDSGISNATEIATAVEAGIEVIVTDHHTIPSIMPERATAILHPNLPECPYPFRELSGSGVAYKLAVALMHHLRGPEQAKVWQKKLADLASLGTVSDCVPLVGENRWIVKQGIEQMRQTEWEGLRILLKNAGVEEIKGFDSDIIGFRVGPRLNASGRLQTPYYSLQTLLNENGKAHEFAEKLEGWNHERRGMVEVAFKQAEEQLRLSSLDDQHSHGPSAKLLIAWSHEWPAGIIGLVAARLSEKYYRPTIIMEDRGDHMVASCRSIENFNMVDCLTSAKDHLKSYGGHAMAAGFTLTTEKLPHFLEAVERHAETKLGHEELIPPLVVDYEVSLDELTFDLLDALALGQPYGVGNLKPRFILKNVQPTQVQSVGRERNHLKFNVQSHGAIAFKFGPHFTQLQAAQYEAKPIDVVFELERNVWNGKESLQLQVVDLKIGGDPIT